QERWVNASHEHGTRLKPVFQLFHARTDVPRMPRRLRSVAETPVVLHEKDSPSGKGSTRQRPRGSMLRSSPMSTPLSRTLSLLRFDRSLPVRNLLRPDVGARITSSVVCTPPFVLILAAGDCLFGTLRKYRIEGRCQ